ncbi:hypothetical protein [Janthinobacterium sp. NKUCC06_STL]|uniref:hypothetical protein n=1 Tax=Janthinobacterium sp. NKUCC06_STL TaxID=2842127 RepID=UPI001C5B1614|nr:hypothetical protein [Janthinobacterium sp. NKUCC06_STL]MBW3512921.1 hypothetical protein [Janthinobacterium sp. NKUCC06_STL]
MSTISDSTILLMQCIASTFMAADYFLSSGQREVVNKYVKEYAEALKKRTEKSIKEATDEVFVENFSRVLTSMIFLFVLLVGSSALHYLKDELNQWFILVGVIILMIALVGSFSTILSSALRLFTPVVLGGTVWSLASFVSFCHKGSIFAIGFIFLVISFIFRYVNI